MSRKLSLRSQAIAFCIWRHCEPLAWDVTISEAAEALDLPVAQVRRVADLMSWCGKFRTGRVQYGDKALILSYDEQLEAMA